MKPETDVFVVGGGPAGLAAAIAARQRGFDVTVADGAEPPIDKPCGEGMMPETLAALRDLGVVLPAQEGYRIRGIRFVAGGVEVAADFPQGQGIGIRRPILHGLLLEEAARLGVGFLWKAPVGGIDVGKVRLPKGTVEPRWIVGADGSGSRVRRWSGLESFWRRAQRSATRRHYRVRPWSEYAEVYWGARSQAYVTPISGEEVCIAVMAERAEEAEFERALADLPQLRERLAGAELASRERGALTAMLALRRVSRGNVALVGDASGGVDAVTGEGLRLAFRQAQALVQALERRDFTHYERAHRRLARRPMYMGNLLLQLGRHAWLRERAMRTMQRRAKLFEQLLAVHVGYATPKDALAASAELGWQFLAS